MTLVEEYGLLGLFISAFISSTLFPGGSEAVLIWLASEQKYTDWQLLLAATSGNTLGAMTTWLLGWWLARRFPQRALDEKKHERALRHIRRWGSPILLLSWLPVIGDPLCFVAGWLKLSLLSSVLFITAGKALRYAALLFFM